MKLSVVMCGRNDDYGGDFIWRLQTCLDSIAAALPDAEVLVADWGGERGLSEDLDSPVVKFLRISPDMAARHNKLGYTFHGSKAINAGIRRAEGDAILICSADSLFTSILADWIRDMFHVPQYLPRKEVPYGVWSAKPIMDDLMEYALLKSHHLPVWNWYHGMCGEFGAIMLRREIWHELRGTREDYAGYGMRDIDLGFRLNMKYKHTISPVPIFDMGREPGTGEHGRHTEIIRGVPKSFAVNDEDWGLVNEDIPVERSTGTRKPKEPDLPDDPAGRPKDLAKILMDTIKRRKAQNILIENITRDFLYLYAVEANPAIDIWGLDSFSGADNYAPLHEIRKQLVKARYVGNLFLNSKHDAFPIRFDVGITSGQKKFDWKAGAEFSR